jgi:hypothetical protein
MVVLEHCSNDIFDVLKSQEALKRCYNLGEIASIRSVPARTLEIVAKHRHCLNSSLRSSVMYGAMKCTVPAPIPLNLSCFNKVRSKELVTPHESYLCRLKIVIQNFNSRRDSCFMGLFPEY